MNTILNSLNNGKIKKSETPKLLIIGCGDQKSLQPNNLANGNISNYNFGDAINNSRQARLDYYLGLNAKYFHDKKRGGQTVSHEYFMNALNNNNRRQALDVYESNHSPFYNQKMKRLYRTKILDSNLHLLIVSGLYGIVKHDDYINDYHLTINMGGISVWESNISNAVKEYININAINDDAVFYSLSNSYLSVLQANKQWTNLWGNYSGRGWDQAKDLNTFLNHI